MKDTNSKIVDGRHEEGDSIYFITDYNNNYVDENCLYTDKQGKLNYVPFEFIINGCNYFEDIETAQQHLHTLNSLSKTYNKDYHFKISSDIYNDIILKEILVLEK